MRGPSIYFASKTSHAPKWQALRSAGVRVISTWIDEAGPGESANLPDLARRCIAEAASADTLILYAEPGDVLKGALIEAGAALAAGRPVVQVGQPDNWPTALAHHPLWTEAPSIKDALAFIRGERIAVARSTRPRLRGRARHLPFAPPHLAQPGRGRPVGRDPVQRGRRRRDRGRSPDVGRGSLGRRADAGQADRGGGRGAGGSRAGRGRVWRMRDTRTKEGEVAGPFAVGDHVEKRGGDYRFEGAIVAAFEKRSGAIRYVVEDNRGLLFIFGEANLRKRCPVASEGSPHA